MVSSLFPLTGLGVCTVSDDESAALHRDIVKLTWTTAPSGRRPPWLPGTGVLACLRIFRVAGWTWLGAASTVNYNNLQSDNTFAREHRQIRNELPHLEARKSPHSFTASAYDNLACQDSNLGPPEWSQLSVHSSGRVFFWYSGSIFPSVVFPAANHRDLEPTCSAAADECNGWRLIHVQPAVYCRRNCPLGTCPIARCWESGASESHSSRGPKCPSDRWHQQRAGMDL